MRDTGHSGPNLIGPVIIGIFLVLAGVAFAVVQAVISQEQDGGTGQIIAELERKLERSDRLISGLQRDIKGLQSRVQLLEAGGGGGGGSQNRQQRGGFVDGIDPATLTADLTENESQPDTEGLTDKVIIGRDRFNEDLTQAGSRFMKQTLGNPRETYSTECQSVTNPRLRGALETRQIGPIRVTMLRPALDSIEQVLNRLRVEEPDIYAKLGTAGALCARNIRGSSTSVSNHSWGTAIDLKIDNQLDPFADGSTQVGLLLLAEMFNDAGWYWGAGWGREDSMHFEASQELILGWVSEQAL